METYGGSRCIDTSFLDLGTSCGGELHAPAVLPNPGQPSVPIRYEIEWAPEPVWTTWGNENSRTATPR
jgi:hypothetical protein